MNPTKVDFKICQSNCDPIVFSDTTGLQDLQPFGYDPTLVLTYTGTISIFNQNGDLLGTIAKNPSNNYAGATIEISPSDVSLTSFSDGIYLFQYTVLDELSNEVGTKVHYVIISCEIRCCLEKMLKSILSSTCPCSVAKFQTYLKHKLLFDTLDDILNCGGILAANETFEKLKNFCKSENCNCK